MVSANAQNAAVYTHTLPAARVTETTASLRAMVTPNALEAAFWFEWGADDSFSNSTPPRTLRPGERVEYVTESISGLTRGTIYRCRVVVTNSAGVFRGYERRFGVGHVIAWGDDGFQTSGMSASLTNVVAIAGGFDPMWDWQLEHQREYHHLALRTDGSVAAWGSNGSGQTNVPPGLTNVVAIAKGHAHSMALRADGTVAVWGGFGYYFGLHDVPHIFPAFVPASLTDVVSIAAGFGHCLALRSDGTVVVWGVLNFDDPTVIDGETPAVAADLRDVVGIAGGFDQSLALRSDGTIVTLHSWHRAPVNLKDIVAIALGDNHCLALRRNGTVAAWEAFGGPQANVPAGLDRVVDISAAGRNHRSVLRSDGTVVAWGDHSGLPIGLTNVVALSPNSFLALVASSPPVFSRSEPVVAGVGSAFRYRIDVNNATTLQATGLPDGLSFDPATGLIIGTALIAGDYPIHLTAKNAHGTGMATLIIRVSPVVAWGEDSEGRTSVPPGLDGAVAIAAGAAHSLALQRNGTVVAWGYNRYGATNVPTGLMDVVAIAASGNYNLALLANGMVVSWGSNLLGPAEVPAGLKDVVAIAAGVHSLALRKDGTVVSWGRASVGLTHVPDGLANVVAIAAGGTHSLALRSDGTVVAWGDRTAGNVSPPAALKDVVAIAAGSSHSLALRNDGTVVAWGDDSRGQTRVPSGLTDIVSIAAGGTHSVALRRDGTLAVWGESSSAENNRLDSLTNVASIAAGSWHTLALLHHDSIAIPRLQILRGNSGIELHMDGAQGLSGQLLRSSQVGGPWLPALPVTFTREPHILPIRNSEETAQFFHWLRR